MVTMRADLDQSMPLFSVLWDLYWGLESALPDDKTYELEHALNCLDLAWNEGRVREAVLKHQELEKTLGQVLS